MNQIALPFGEPVAGLFCAFGVPWPHYERCPKCEAECDRLDGEFFAAVAAGKFNALGYTKSEWKQAGYAMDQWQAGIKTRQASA